MQKVEYQSWSNLHDEIFGEEVIHEEGQWNPNQWEQMVENG